MKTNTLRIKQVVLPFVLFVVYGCSNKQDVEPIIDPTLNPEVTVTPLGDYSTVTEGDTLEFDITVDALFDQDIDFTAVLDEASVGSSFDFVSEEVTFFAFTSSIRLTVVFLADSFPEVAENVMMRISSEEDPTYNFQLSPISDVEMLNFDLISVNAPDVLSLGAEWPVNDDDWDLYIYDAAGSNVGGTAGATGADPEAIPSVLDNTADDGVYDIVMDPFAVDTEMTTLEVAIATPDGSIQSVMVTIDTEDDEEPVLYGFNHVATLTKSGEVWTLAAVE
ncbi:MAG: hypothetical protein AAF616_08260 [Bacteroidota bacterium]